MAHLKCARRVAEGIALCLLGFATACNGNHEDQSLRPAPVTTRKLQVSGKNLLDEHGRLVLLRGFNASGRSKMPPYAPFDYDDPAQFAAAADNYFASLQNLGANIVRLQFEWEALEPTQGARDMDYWSRYQTLVDSAYAHGMGVIVDAHQDVYASPFCGDGFPIWTLGSIPHGDPNYDCGYISWAIPYENPMSTVSQAFQRFWTDADGIQTAYVSMWQFVAAGLASHPGVAAFEMINEPGAGALDPATFEATTLPAFYERVGTAIRAAAGDFALLGGTPGGDSSTTNTLVAPNLPGYVFGPHYYDSEAFVGVDDVELDRLRTEIEQVITLPGTPNVPVIIGEWGMPNFNTAKAAYDVAMESIYDDLQLNTILWDAHVSATLWNNEDFSVFNPDGSEQPWADSVVRPYPRAVAGASFTFNYDPTTLTFWLQVQGATSGVTEVYLPARVFGGSPHISTDGATWNWLPASETLVVADTKGATYRVDVSK